MKPPWQNSLLGLDLQELTAIVEEMGEPSFRGQQLFEAIYRQRIESVEEVSTLSRELRRGLDRQGYSVGSPDIQRKFTSSDGTIRYLISFADGQTVETVWMPEGDGGEAGDGTESDLPAEFSTRPWHRATICVSSQIGCAVLKSARTTPAVADSS